MRLLLIFTVLGFFARAHATLNSNAKMLIKMLDSLESRRALAEVKIPLSIEFSLKDKIEDWNTRREKLKRLVYWRLRDRLVRESNKLQMSLNGLMSGHYGAELFMREVKSFDIAKSSRESALLENLLLESFADHLREHGNLNPIAWNLASDEWNDLEIKLDEIPAKVGSLNK
jgi:hypothetical protein